MYLMIYLERILDIQVFHSVSIIESKHKGPFIFYREWGGGGAGGHGRGALVGYDYEFDIKIWGSIVSSIK